MMSDSRIKRGTVSRAPRSTLTRSVVVAILCGNLLAYAAYRAVQKSRTTSAAPVVEELVEPAPAPTGRAGAGLARAQRVAGLAALEDGDYEGAVKAFTLAMAGGEGGDSRELLRIARELLDRHRDPRPAAAARATEHDERVERPAERPEPAKEPKEMKVASVAKATNG